MILKRANNGAGGGSKPWEGTLPLTGSAIADFFNPSGAGVSVSESQAMTLAPVFRAVNLIAGSVAGAPRFITDLENGLLKDETQSSIINNPNPMLDPFWFWEYAMVSTLFHGNFYAIAVREAGRGSIKNLTPLDPSMITPKAVIRKTPGTNSLQIIEIVYEVIWKNPDGMAEKLAIPADEIFHIKGLGTNWLEGMSIIEAGARVFSNAVQTDVYAEKFYGNGSLMSGVLTTDKRLDEKSAGALKNRWRQKIQGIENAFDIVVLDSGTGFEPISISPQDAQFLEARRFNVEEIGRMFGIPKELLGEAGMTSPIDPEKIAISFVQFTLRNWGKRIDAAATKQLLPEAQKMLTVFNDLILADERTRSSAAVMWRKAQILSINEIRIANGKAPLANADADDPMFIPEDLNKDVTLPGGNMGNEEQPVPNEQDPAGQSDTDMNDS
jgi:HK97 family phage portal protein